MSAHRYTLFGGLEVVTDSGPLVLGTRKQRAALAQLLLALVIGVLAVLATGLARPELPGPHAP